MSRRHTSQSFFKTFDRYSKGVSLSYNHSTSFTTSMGGACSIISWILLTWWFTTEIYSNYINPAYDITEKQELTQMPEGKYQVWEISNDQLFITSEIYTTNTTIASEELDRYFTPLWVQITFNQTLNYYTYNAYPAISCSNLL